MLNAFLNKGGAGKSITRIETADRLGRLMRRHNELMFAYDTAIARTPSPELAAGLELLNTRNRADIAKISELILSAGSVPPLGTDFQPDDVSIGDTDDTATQALLDLERAYKDALAEELKAKHMLRTFATLETNLKNTNDRIELLQRMSSKLRLGSK